MTETAVAFGALPNLHPALVHFPVALLIAALGLDALSLLLRRQSWLDRAAGALYLMGAAGAGAAYLAGRAAADGLTDVPPAAEMLLGEHADWAGWTLLCFSVLAVARAGLSWWDRKESRSRLYPVRVLIVVAGAAAQWLMVETADRGGALVFRHGVAVTAPARKAAPRRATPTRGVTPPPKPRGRPADPPRRRLVRNEDGSLVWTPLPGDGKALGDVLTAVGGSSAVKARAPVAGTTGAGLALEVNGRAILLLPGTFGNVRVEARLALGRFQGTVGVAHHVRDLGSAGLCHLSTGGKAALVRMMRGKANVLHWKPLRLPGKPFTLAVSAAGSHFKGMLDGKVVVHGHHRPDAKGGVGLYLNGTGAVKILSMRVVPLRRH